MKEVAISKKGKSFSISGDKFLDLESGFLYKFITIV